MRLRGACAAGATRGLRSFESAVSVGASSDRHGPVLPEVAAPWKAGNGDASLDVSTMACDEVLLGSGEEAILSQNESGGNGIENALVSQVARGCRPALRLAAPRGYGGLVEVA